MFKSVTSMAGRLVGYSAVSQEEKDLKFKDSLDNLQARYKILVDADPGLALTDAALRRYLRAFLTTECAFNAIVNCHTWRREFGVDALTADDPDVMAEKVKGKARLLKAKDLKGRPIVHVAVRKHKATDTDMGQLTKFTVFMMEQAAQRIDESVIDNVCIIFDMKDFSMANMDYQFVKILIDLMNKYYPERLGVCLIVNAPYIFQGCWAIIRPLLNEVTASKVMFVTGQDDLTKYIDISALTSK